MRLLPLLSLPLFGLFAVQRAPVPDVWEKPLAPGLVYREEVDHVTPRVVHALRWSLRAPSVRAVPALTGRTVYEDATPTGRDVVSKMVKGMGGIAGVNADFFVMQPVPSGQPLGLMVQNGELVAAPSKRTVFAWGPEGAAMGTASFSGSARPEGGAPMDIAGLNRTCGQNEIVLNTPIAGYALGTAPCAAVTIRMESSAWSPSTTLAGTVEAVSADLPKTRIAPGRAVLVGRGDRVPLLTGLRPGSKVVISLRTTGFDWEQIDAAVGGGPALVRDGKAANAAETEGFRPDFYARRHPRTAIGRTKDGDLWLVAVDGRQPFSEGATLDEMTEIMLRLGCVDALNLDGGGSTTMNVFGVTVNRPSDGRERPVANGIVLTGPRPSTDARKLRIVVPPKVDAAGTIDLRVAGPKGEAVPNLQVLWSSTGSGWIDGGGRLWPLGTGPCTITAFVGGQSLTAKTQITGKAKPYRQQVLPQDYDPDHG